MDPNANLQEQERILNRYLTSDRRMLSADMRRLEELREALGGWLRVGGFAPRWDECPIASRAACWKPYCPAVES